MVSPEGYTERDGRAALIEMDHVPNSPDEVLALFAEGAPYDGMLEPEDIEVIRSQVAETATEENPFGRNIEVTADDSSGGCIVDVLKLKQITEEGRRRVRETLRNDPATMEKVRGHSGHRYRPPAVAEGRLDPQVLEGMLRESIEDDIEQQGGLNG